MKELKEEEEEIYPSFLYNICIQLMLCKENIEKRKFGKERLFVQIFCYIGFVL